MQAEQINASIAGTSHGAYILGRTVKEWIANQGRDGYFTLTLDDEPILDDEMYFVNEHGVWLVE